MRNNNILWGLAGDKRLNILSATGMRSLFMVGCLLIEWTSIAYGDPLQPFVTSVPVSHPAAPSLTTSSRGVTSGVQPLLPSTLQPLVIKSKPMFVTRHPVAVEKPIAHLIQKTMPPIVTHDNAPQRTFYRPSFNRPMATATIKVTRLAEKRAAQVSPPPLVMHGQVQTPSITVPAQTVMNIVLDKTLISTRSQVGDPVTAVVQDSVYVGPYRMVPAGATLTGRITAIQSRRGPDNLNPYMLIRFNRLQRQTDRLSIQAELIAYKTGLKKSDYLWKLPEKPRPLRQYTFAALEGALTGFFVNPLIGPPVGALTWMLAALTKNRIAQRGVIVLKAGEPLPIAVQQPFQAKVVDPPGVTNRLALR